MKANDARSNCSGRLRATRRDVSLCLQVLRASASFTVARTRGREKSSGYRRGSRGVYRAPDASNLLRRCVHVRTRQCVQARASIFPRVILLREFFSGDE